jgi:4-amino-4-deoxy-L-arabinose transferase-like glycosyltransferase
LIYGIARQCRSTPRTALRAAIWYNATLLVGSGGHLIVPDGPSSLFWTATLYLLLRAREGGGGDWVLAGLAAGLAVLSKYSALFLAPGVFLWLVSSPQGRARLATPWPWICLLAAASVMSTNVFWNATHGWVSFEKQFGRAAAERFTPQHLLELIGTQLLLINPLMAPFALSGVWLAISRRTRPLDGLWLLAAVTLPLAAYLAVHSLHAGVQGHWPAPLYPGLAILAAVAAQRVAGWRGLCARGVEKIM